MRDILLSIFCFFFHRLDGSAVDSHSYKVPYTEDNLEPQAISGPETALFDTLDIPFEGVAH